MNRFFRSALFPLIVIVLLVYLASQTLMNEKPKDKVTYSQLQAQVRTGEPPIKEVVINPNKQELTVGYSSPESLRDFEALMREQKVDFDSKSIGGSPWWSLLTSLLPFVLLFGFWIFLMNQVQGGGSKVMSFGKSRAKRMTPDSPKIGFKDVAGA